MPELRHIPSTREPQVGPEHYDFENYDDLERWISYWYQIRAALRLGPRTALEIGTGSGVFRSYLERAGVAVTGFDLDPSRRPEFVGDVGELDAALPEGLGFDVVCAFQVLEHLPFARLEDCLAAIARRAKPYALISLPYRGQRIRLSATFGDTHLSIGHKFMLPWKLRLWREHYWELGWGYSARRITKIMSKYFEVKDRYFVKENPYHYLWVLRSRDR